MKNLLWIVGIGLSLDTGPMGSCEAQEVAYQMDFEKIEAGNVPDEFLVLDGAFGVKEEGGNKFLELPGAPLETFGTLFGPTAKVGLKAGARIFGTSKGRRFPVMGVGLNGAVPLRLQVTPSKKSIELFKGDDLLVSAPYQWTSGTWTEFRLQLTKPKDGEWKVEGKAWKQGDAEPEAWSLTHILTEEPPAGRASVWGKPFSETPIRFDNLIVWKLP